MMLFNPDMDRRLADLHEAACAGAEIAIRHLAGGKYHQGEIPDRVALTWDKREVVFDLHMSAMVSGQMEANGFHVLAGRIREAGA